MTNDSQTRLLLTRVARRFQLKGMCQSFQRFRENVRLPHNDAHDLVTPPDLSPNVVLCPPEKLVWLKPGVIILAFCNSYQ